MIDDIDEFESTLRQKDYRIEVKVKNNFLLSKIESAGFDSVAQFCKANKFCASHVGKFANLKEIPINSRGKWNNIVLKMATALNCLPEDLFPPQHLRTALKKNKASFEAGIEEVAGFLTGSQEDARPALEHILTDEAFDTISDCLKRLSSREERVLRMRYGLTPDGEEKTLQEVGELFDVSREQIRIIEARAMRKMRLRWERGKIPAEQQKRLREAASQLGVNSRQHGPAIDRRYIPEWKKKEI